MTLVVWSKAGQRNFYNITVEQNLEPLRKLLKETFPKEDIHVQSSRESLSLTGTRHEQRRRRTGHRAGDSIWENHRQQSADYLDRGGETDPVAREIRRTRPHRIHAIRRELDIHRSHQHGGWRHHRPVPRSLAPIGNERRRQQHSGTATSFTISQALNIFAFRNDLNLGLFIKALQSRNLLQILAEPNLVTTNGKEATFLVGGEFPIPVLQGGANSGAVTIQFREFGVRLNFNPTVTENNTISMHVKPEVSTLDYTNATVL